MAQSTRFRFYLVRTGSVGPTATGVIITEAPGMPVTAIELQAGGVVFDGMRLKPSQVSDGARWS